jgi:hypothetical protein
MSPVADAPAAIPPELLDAALGLPPAARREMGERLLASLHTSPPLSPEWRDEIARRLAADDAGQLRGYSLSETAAYLQAVVDEGRRP